MDDLDLEEFRQRLTAVLEELSARPDAQAPTDVVQEEGDMTPENPAQAKEELVEWLRKNWWPKAYPGYDPERGFDAGEEEEGNGGGERR